MLETSRLSRLFGRDYVLLLVVCLALYGVALIDGRPLSGHESVLPQNAREMMVNHSWMIPTMGGKPWLERPPVPDWIMVGIGEIIGRCDQDWIVRIGPLLMACLVVFLVAGMAARWYGRAVGLVSGLILATMWEFYTFATDPEGDMFLCVVVTAAMAVFARLQTDTDAAEADGRISLFGPRPWRVWAFFALLAMTNWAKGPIFGTLMVGVPVSGYLLATGSWQAVRRYLWWWGVVIFAVLALAWPVIVYLRYPGIMDLWRDLFGDRVHQSPFTEPWWYYAVQVPYITLPWSLLALGGLLWTARPAWRERFSPERFLWIWAILTPAVFSIPHGKHHHYLLQCMAPWAVLAGLAAVRVWEAIPSWPVWLRQPLVGAAVLSVPADVAIILLRHKLRGPVGFVPALLVAVPLCLFVLGWLVNQRRGRLAVGGVFAVLIGFYGLLYDYQTRYFNSYADDLPLLRQASDLARAGSRVFVSFDVVYPLETFHLMFYSDKHVNLLYNLTFLLDNAIHEQDVYVLGRACEQAELSQY
ncbi:MAG TPA: glycosyltransferase family 39 protein, partial [Gemmataceae bacterium]|nr:glycosyltransferase family 39 protein [Gemmataceae bacterium]